MLLRGFEPRTFSLRMRCSNQLSHRSAPEREVCNQINSIIRIVLLGPWQSQIITTSTLDGTVVCHTQQLTVMTTSTPFIGGSLSFKGDKSKTKKKKSKSKHKLDDKHQTNRADTGAEEDLTEAEKKALRKKKERERQELEIVAKKSHRERIEEFNQSLASVTEHNDIPRVSWFLSSLVAAVWLH